MGRSLWPGGLRLESASVPLLRLGFRISPMAWMPVCCECHASSYSFYMMLSLLFMSWIIDWSILAVAGNILKQLAY